MTWIQSEYDLPPKDGMYEVTNNTEDLIFSGYCMYDGYGFKYGLVYKEPKFWREYIQTYKKYGKQK